MSYPCSKSDAESTIASIELSENTRSNMGSNILHGSTTPGGAANGKAPSNAVMTQKRTKLHTRTDELTRLYGATDREHKKGI
jgi:hypothetical protein